MKIAALFILSIVLMTVVSGCSKQVPTTDTQVQGDAQAGQATEEAETVAETVDDSLIDEENDVDLGEMI